MPKLLLNKQVLATQVWIADTSWSRAKGLLGRPSFPITDAMWIRPCNSIHTFFMKFPIDVAFVGRDLKVKRLIANIEPGQLVWPIWSAHSVFEFAAGFLERNPIHVGDQLHVDS